MGLQQSLQRVSMNSKEIIVKPYYLELNGKRYYYHYSISQSLYPMILSNIHGKQDTIDILCDKNTIYGIYHDYTLVLYSDGIYPTSSGWKIKS